MFARSDQDKKDKTNKKLSPLTAVCKAVATVLLLFLMFYLCGNFMVYQRNATNQVNKYRIDQVCLMSDKNVVAQDFQAKHTHLKTVKLYFSNDYGSEAKGTIDLVIWDPQAGEEVTHVTRNINELANNEYTDFDTDIQLAQYKTYRLIIRTSNTESGKEPIVYQWSSREKGFQGKMLLNGQKQRKYLVAKFYYPVMIYYQWIGIAFCFLVIILLVLFPIPASDRIKAVAGYVMFAAAPLFTFWFVERFTDNLVYRMRPGEAAFNILLYYMFFLLLWIIFGSKKISLLLGMGIWYVIGLGNYFVLSFKGSPIVPSDLRSAGTAASVAGNYTYNIQPVFVWNAIFILLYLALFFRLDKKVRFPLKWRGAALLAILALSVGLSFLVVEQKTLKSAGIKNNVWDQKKGYAKNGLFFGFVLNMNSLIQEKPSEYSKSAAEAIARKYEEQFANAKRKKGRLAPKKKKKPNIIVIMNEAFSDLSVVGDFSTNQDYMPYIHSLKKNTIKGNLYMSIFGSGTCNSEFEFLSGNTLAFLNSGIITYTQVIKDKLPNVTWNLRAQGYGGNLALHPYLASGWNRIDIYEKEGFEHFYSQDDFTNPLMYRKYISDQSDFEKIEELYENRENKDEPFYLFNVTMQNHGGFNKLYDNFYEDVHITDEIHQSQQADQYLSLVKKTDEAFRQLTQYFKNVDEPTIIVMYGDHQPSLESSFYDGLLRADGGKVTQEDMMKKYQVPFIIWTNYKIKSTTIDKMSANYLGAYVMQEAGLKLSPYQQFLMKLYKDVPVLSAMGTIDKDGNFYSSYEDSPYKDMITEYQILQYNNLIDTKHIVESFFYVKEP